MFKLLNPITWGRANMNAVFASAAGGLVFWLLGFLKLNLVLGLQFAIAIFVVLFVFNTLHASAPTSVSQANSAGKRHF